MSATFQYPFLSRSTFLVPEKITCLQPICLNHRSVGGFTSGMLSESLGAHRPSSRVLGKRKAGAAIARAEDCSRLRRVVCMGTPLNRFWLGMWKSLTNS